LNDFLHRKGREKGSEMVAFVMPEFELIRGTMPDNKAELLSHLLDRKLKPKGDFDEAHASSNLERWQKFKASSSELIDAAYKLDKFSFGYQPAVITKKTCPFFDERYTADSMAKFSQVNNCFYLYKLWVFLTCALYFREFVSALLEKQVSFCGQ
jgi:hypothetical protein